MDPYQYFLLIPIIFSIFFWPATVYFTIRFRRFGRKPPKACNADAFAPFISIIKPVCGLEKKMYTNLMSACWQDYDPYEVIFAVHNKQDPALEAIERVKADCPQENIQIVIDENRIGANGKISNLQNGLSRAGGEIIVVSDSDMYLAPDYLRHLVAPFADSQVGIVCTLYRARQPDNLLSSLELLTYNADFVPAMIFAFLTGASLVCPGASMAIRRELLDSIGGLTPLRDHFVEDYELGRRVAVKGYRVELIPYVVEMDIEVPTWADWWRHQVGWDQKTRCVKIWWFLCTLLLRGIPFALLYAAMGKPFAWGILLLTVATRIVTGILNARLLDDIDGLRRIWLLPVRDVLGLLIWVVSLFKRNTCWRGRTFLLKKGKLVVVR